MDDNLEKPTAELKAEAGDDLAEEEQSSGTKIKAQSCKTSDTKRGDKEYEPSKKGGSGLQQHILQRSRNAMFEALRADRTISNKSLSYGTWHPSIARVSVTVARGTRDCYAKRKFENTRRLELLPEEAIYLIERGSLLCWKESEMEYLNEGIFESVSGSPMTVQQAYTEMIGKEDLTMDRYQVYAYLKRLGYAVTRTKPPSIFYPTAVPYPPSSTASFSPLSIVGRISALFSSWISKISFLFLRNTFNWWRPLQFSNWFKKDKNYAFIFRSLRFIPSGNKVPIYTPPETKLPLSPYEPFFNLYKPPTPFRKSAPPPPDYQMVVVNARTTPMPSLRELTAIYDNAPELPPPQRRVRNPPQAQGVSYKKSATNPNPNALPDTQSQKPDQSTASPSQSSEKSSIISGLASWFHRKPVPPPAKPQRKPNPFAVLRQGKKTAIIATVDAGTINIFRFAQGAFEVDPWF
ncbi:hypothetical protein C8R42DRAFT_704989 [Lentinula raphanica]|nr:hypothetical protein C8R42DRAFT_704989 [Lentinula raphanica]